MLALAAIRRQLDRLAIGTMERFVDIQHRLHGVVAGRNILQTRARITRRLIADRQRPARFPAIDGYAEHHLRFRRVIDLQARLGLRIGHRIRVVRDQKQQSSIQRLVRARGGEAHADGLSLYMSDAQHTKRQ